MVNIMALPEKKNRWAGRRTQPGGSVSCWLILLLVILAGEGLFAIGQHRSERELRTALQKNSPRQQLHALFILTNRHGVAPDELAAPHTELTSDGMLLREWTMTLDFARASKTRARQERLLEPGDSPEGRRSRFLLKYRPEQHRSMTLAELAAFLDASNDSS